jgi:hypothetical protein
MALPLIPFAIGIAVGALAASVLRGTRAGATMGRQARRLVDEVGDRLSDALSRKGRLVREYYPEPPAGHDGADAAATSPASTRAVGEPDTGDEGHADPPRR